MLRLLIADDEKTIRETINTLIDWESLNIEVVGLCKNGLEAYDAILDKYPDIVLTDIQMPKLSGLELIRKITENNDNIQFIILSGYNEFSYAREAMRYGIKHYVLKPCNETEIIAAIKEAIQDHYSKLALQNPYHNSDSMHYREYIMYDMLLRVLSSKQSWKQITDIYESHFDFYHTSYQLYYLHYIEESHLDSCLNEIRHLMKAKKIPYIYTFIYVTNTLLFFLPETDKYFQNMENILLGNLTRIDKQSPQTYKQEYYENLSSLLQALYQKLKRYATIYLYSDTQCLSICNYDSMFLEITAISDSLFQATEESEIQYNLDELKKLLLSVTNKEFLCSTANNLLLQSTHSSNFYNTNDIISFIMNMKQMSDYKDICDFLIDKLYCACTVNLKEKKTYKPFIQEILSYTNEHLSSPDLTLKGIVENHLYMNVDYVSRQFVLQTGIKFSAYLNELRIKKAKELLLNSDNEKIYCVAEQIGCGNNPQYFSHLFKKYTKMTPKEYIQKIKSEPE